jgi:hypothetical protein
MTNRNPRGRGVGAKKDLIYLHLEQLSADLLEPNEETIRQAIAHLLIKAH